MARPADEQGHPNAALVEADFAAAETARSFPAKRWQRPVVARENEDRVFLQPERFQAGKQTADLLIVFLQHGLEIRRALVIFAPALFQIAPGGDPRSVNIIRPKIYEARLALVAP